MQPRQLFEYLFCNAKIIRFPRQFNFKPRLCPFITYYIDHKTVWQLSLESLEHFYNNEKLFCRPNRRINPVSFLSFPLLKCANSPSTSVVSSAPPVPASPPTPSPRGLPRRWPTTGWRETPRESVPSARSKSRPTTGSPDYTAGGVT